MVGTNLACACCGCQLTQYEINVRELFCWYCGVNNHNEGNELYWRREMVVID